MGKIVRDPNLKYSSNVPVNKVHLYLGVRDPNLKASSNIHLYGKIWKDTHEGVRDPNLKASSNRPITLYDITA